MHKITLITPPDKIFNNNYSILLLYPSQSVKDQFQRSIAYLDHPFNVYVYEADDLSHDVDWLLSMVKIANVVIFDIDNTSSKIRTLASYIIANSNTYWLTNDNEPFYNKLSVNRIYNLDFLQTLIGEYFETQTELPQQQQQ